MVCRYIAAACSVDYQHNHILALKHQICFRVQISATNGRIIPFYSLKVNDKHQKSYNHNKTKHVISYALFTGHSFLHLQQAGVVQIRVSQSSHTVPLNQDVLYIHTLQ